MSRAFTFPWKYDFTMACFRTLREFKMWTSVKLINIFTGMWRHEHDEIFTCEYAFAGSRGHSSDVIMLLELWTGCRSRVYPFHTRVNSGSASLRKVWAGTRWTLQATSGTASPLQASSGAGSPILQSAHLYAKPGSLGNCLELEGSINQCWMLILIWKDLIGWPLKS